MTDGTPAISADVVEKDRITNRDVTARAIGLKSTSVRLGLVVLKQASLDEANAGGGVVSQCSSLGGVAPQAPVVGEGAVSDHSVCSGIVAYVNSSAGHTHVGVESTPVDIKADSIAVNSASATGGFHSIADGEVGQG